MGEKLLFLIWWARSRNLQMVQLKHKDRWGWEEYRYVEGIQERQQVRAPGVTDQRALKLLLQGTCSELCRTLCRTEAACRQPLVSVQEGLSIGLIRIYFHLKKESWVGKKPGLEADL